MLWVFGIQSHFLPSQTGDFYRQWGLIDDDTMESIYIIPGENPEVLIELPTLLLLNRPKIFVETTEHAFQTMP